MLILKVDETWPVCTVCNGWVMLLVCMGKTRFGGIIWGEVVMMHAQIFLISMYFLRVPALTQALPCPSTRARLTVVFLTAPLGFLLWALPCPSSGPGMAVVFLTFSVCLHKGWGGIRRM